jgi:hypothetical protein
MPKGHYDRAKATPTQPEMEKKDLSKNTPLVHSPMNENERIAKLESIIEQQKKDAEQRDKVIAEVLKEVRTNQQVPRPSGATFDPTDPAFMAVMERLAQGKFTTGNILRDAYADDNDKLPEPKTVFTNKSGILIDFFMRSGTLIGLPDGIRGPLKFETLYRDAEEDTQRISYRGVLIIHSKRLWESIQKDDRWGTIFFPDDKVIARQDNHSKWTQFYNTFLAIWRNRDENLVLSEAKRLGLPTSSTNKEYRELIAGALADEAVKAEEDLRLDNIRASADTLLRKEGVGQAVTA